MKRTRVPEPRTPSGKTRKKPASPRKVLLWVALAGILFGLLGLGEPIDLLAHTMRAVVNQRSSSNNIIIIKIDDASLRKVGNWPWSREAQAKLVDRLSAAGARQILYDVIFSYANDPKGDAAFADAKAVGASYLGGPEYSTDIDESAPCISPSRQSCRCNVAL
jgi:CHASE2 domain-containing sensor protein